MVLATLTMLTLDSSGARRDATFWSSILGWPIAHEQDEYAMITGPDTALGFGTLPDHEPPSWPNEHGTKQFPLDLAVDDLESAATTCVELGAPPRPRNNPARRGASCWTRVAIRSV